MWHWCCIELAAVACFIKMRKYIACGVTLLIVEVWCSLVHCPVKTLECKTERRNFSQEHVGQKCCVTRAKSKPQFQTIGFGAATVFLMKINSQLHYKWFVNLFLTSWIFFRIYLHNWQKGHLSFLCCFDSIYSLCFQHISASFPFKT